MITVDNKKQHLKGYERIVVCNVIIHIQRSSAAHSQGMELTAIRAGEADELTADGSVWQGWMVELGIRSVEDVKSRVWLLDVYSFLKRLRLRGF